MTRRKTRTLLTLGIVVILLLLMIYPAYRFYQRIQFDASALSPAGKIVKAYADEHDIPFQKYPEELIALLDRNPETETFVLEGQGLTDGKLEYEVREDADYTFQLKCDDAIFDVSISVWE